MRLVPRKTIVGTPNKSGAALTDLDAIFYHGPNFELEKPGNDRFRHSFPMIVISGQVKRETCMRARGLSGLRQLGD